jgi:UDP-GlcNAc3NAcA epimerase
MSHSASFSRRTNKRLRLVIVVGSRTQILKAGALWPELQRRHDPLLIDSGEQGGRSRPFYGELGVLAPDRVLRVARRGFAEDLERQLPAMLHRLGPTLVVALGDSSTTLAAARVARAARIPIARVDAGIRSLDPEMQAERSREIDRISALWFCATPVAVEHLRREGIVADVHLVGDLVVDAALRFRELAQRRSTALADWGLMPGGFLLVAVHGPNLKSRGRPARLIRLLAGLHQPMVFPIDSHTQSLLRATGLLERLEAIEGLRLTPPLRYLDLLRLADDASHVLTDLWPLTKQAYALATPCLTLADHTEWVDTVAAGWNTIVGVDPDAVAAALAAPPPEQWPELYGGGHAAERISDLLAGWATTAR